ncbi:MAG: hypothetical protein AB1778_06630 [Candidatus Bipolaricaulota bacterium]
MSVPVPDGSEIEPWFTGAAAVIALVALVVAILARGDARRAAAAAEEAARQARRSANADEQTAGLAAQEAARQATERHDAEGPAFEPELVGNDNTMDVHLTVLGAPGPIEATVTLPDPMPWATGLRQSPNPGSPLVDAVTIRDLDRGSRFTVFIGLAAPDEDWEDQRIITLCVAARLQAEPEREWTRRVIVPWPNTTWGS